MENSHNGTLGKCRIPHVCRHFDHGLQHFNTQRSTAAILFSTYLLQSHQGLTRYVNLFQVLIVSLMTFLAHLVLTNANATLAHIMCPSSFPGMWAGLGRSQLAAEGAESWRGGPSRGRPRRYGRRTSCNSQLIITFLSIAPSKSVPCKTITQRERGRKHVNPQRLTTH
jgi:hypothetical protein